MDDANVTMGHSNIRGPGATLHVYVRPASRRAYARTTTLRAYARPASHRAYARLASLRACARPSDLCAYAMPITLHVRRSHAHEDGPPQPQPNIPPQSQKGSCTPIASLEIPEGDHPCFLFLNSPRRHVARGTVYNKGGVTPHTMSLPPGHHKVSIDVVQSHEKDSPLPVPIEDENLITLRDAIGTYVAWPRSLINLPPRVPPPSSKGKENEHFQTKEFVTSPMKGSVHRIILEEFAAAEGILAFKNLRIMVQGDVFVHVVENTYSKDYWGKEFKDKIGTNEIIELKEKKTVNAHIVQALQRYANQGHLVLVPCNVGDHWVLIVINTSDETVYYMDPFRHHYMKQMDLHNIFHNVIITYRTARGVKVNRTKMHQSTWVNVQLCTNNFELSVIQI
ncbi:Ulp1 protease family, C-terminal catalytic domain [Sesbania bispinosa]|nr:Ulp1 protease family, C-terminal catalytic domain [Sesbania bispinosa]